MFKNILLNGRLLIHRCQLSEWMDWWRDGWVLWCFISSSFPLNPKQFFSTLSVAGWQGDQLAKLIYGCLQLLCQKQATAITDILPLHLFKQNFTTFSFHWKFVLNDILHSGSTFTVIIQHPGVLIFAEQQFDMSRVANFTPTLSLWTSLRSEVYLDLSQR